MNWRQYYLLTWRWYLFLLAGLGVYSGVIRLWVAVIFFSASFFNFTPWARHLKGRERAWLLAVGGMVLIVAATQVLRYTQAFDIVSIMIETIFGFLPITLLTHEKPRSYWLSVFNGAVIAIGCVSLEGDVTSYLLFTGILAMMIFNLNAANVYLAMGRTRGLRSLPPRFFHQFLTVIPVGALSAALIFVAFPRMKHFTAALGSWGELGRTGYTGKVSLTGGREIEQSQAIALTLEADDKGWLKEKGPGILLRGNSLEHFDGRDWSTAITGRHPTGRVRDLRISRGHSKEIRELMVYSEPTPRPAIFYPGVLMSVQSKKPRFRAFHARDNGDVLRSQPEMGRFSYLLRFAEFTGQRPRGKARPPGKGEGGLSPSHLSSAGLKANLEIPAEIRQAAWFDQWLRTLEGESPPVGHQEIMERISGHFLAHFEGSLINEFSSAATLESFLTKDRRGHCEYFASAAVLALRAFGIPSRMVLGYRGGTFNDVAGVLEVRELNAHAWVEVYEDGLGWRPFDPTPIGPPREDMGPFERRWRTYLNAFSFYFHRYVIDYNFDTQRDLIRSVWDVNEESEPLRNGWKESLQKSVYLGLAAAALLLLGVLLFLWRRFSLEKKGLPPYYSKFSAAVARAGYERRKGETYREFHLRVIGGGFDGTVVREVDQALEEDLYLLPVPAKREELLDVVLKRFR